MSTHIEAILFDMGGTLRSSVKVSQAEKDNAILQIIKLLNADAAVGEFSKMLSERADAYKKWAERTLKELCEEELWTQWMLPNWPGGLVRANAVKLNQLFRDSLSTRVVFPDTYDAIVGLYRRGYRLGLVSNTTSSVEVPALLKELHIFGCFETVILSTVIGMRKPDPNILLDATERMGVDPSKCAYIGDQPKRDVAAAQKAGFAKSIIIRHELKKKKETSVDDPLLVPDHKIINLKELLDIFPEREPVKPAKVYNASLSTMWLKDNFPTLTDFFEFARRSGFSHVELNHKINTEMLAGVEMSRYSFSSIHEPCPADIAMPVLVKQDWLISSLDEGLREKGVEAISRSIDFAHKYGIPSIVVHPGQILMDVNLEKGLRNLIQAGKGDSEEFHALKAQMVQARSELAPAAFDSVRKSIVELAKRADKLNVRLGLENRNHFREIPSPDEMEVLLSLGDPRTLGMTFDVGHAMHLSRLGFYPFESWLKRYSIRIFETHLHDIRGVVDHYAAGLGEVDFDLVGSYLPANAIRTCEFLDTNTPEEVLSGLRYLSVHHCIHSM
jgi:FMN phosphatase YigB (HAD superfamily)/sugar phosphate isomerase/epimerase